MAIEKIKKSKIIAVGLFVLLALMVTAGCNLINLQTQNSPTQLGDPEQKSDVQLEAVLSLPEEIPLCSPVKLEFKVTNQSDEAVYLLNWYTPLEGILGDIFQVTYEGQELAYLGPQVMREAPLPNQYVYLEPGGSTSNVVNLSSVYDFSQAGTYEIAYQSPSISHLVIEPSEFASSLSALGPVQISSQPVEVEVVTENGESCQANVSAPTGPDGDESQPDAPLITLTGIVKEVSLSAQIIRFENEVDGFSVIAITGETMITTASGSSLELKQIQQGLTIEAAGIPGDNHALIAQTIKVVPPEGKSN